MGENREKGGIEVVGEREREGREKEGKAEGKGMG